VNIEGVRLDTSRTRVVSAQGEAERVQGLAQAMAAHQRRALPMRCNDVCDQGRSSRCWSCWKRRISGS
jgi:hypothetical protein